MDQVDASFVISGEVVGQRPMSQKRRDLDIIARDAGLEDLLLRPLSAKLLPPTLPERLGIIDREQLYGIEGRSRKGLIELAHQYGFKEIPQPSTGCALTEPLFANKVRDLIDLSPEARQWDFELLRVGRHFRYDSQSKVVIGKDESQNEHLRRMATQERASECCLLEPENFPGPTALITGPTSDEVLDFAAGLILRYSKSYDAENARLIYHTNDDQRVITANPNDLAVTAETI
jgi:tRNA-uridine 2-sulfurtransferase